ncbi:hypothetical protein [Marilutibacter chinensis]|uniref:Protein ImuA n=1 Tax=Marilutibacter chinensis TaxID=2912247 RepID=A0ABS9HRZ4_9GAMM|nr:hypothetical protein [Lysobacter chinensis]MCF7220892.1 hypothetical protein [Lysobacter chinensis]
MANKSRERWLLQQAGKIDPLLQVGIIEDSEVPDFILRSTDRSIGVEVTEYFAAPVAGRPQQEIQSRKNAVVRRAWEHYLGLGGPAAYVRVCFQSPETLDRKRCDALVAPIAHVVLLHAAGLKWPQSSIAILDGLPAGVASIRVGPSLDGRDQLWHAEQSGWVGEVKAGDVQRVIDRKNKSAAKAKSRCDELWLLICYDWSSGGELVEVRDSVLRSASSGAFNSAFDRVLWLEPQKPRLLKLFPREPGRQKWYREERNV